MNDLVEFLRAQLDDDERVAQPSAVWQPYREGGSDGWAIESADGEHSFLVGPESLARHIARWDPARVLAEIDAKRRILDWLAHVDRFMDRDDMIGAGLSGEVDVEDALKALALPYAERDGYQEQWRP